MKKITFFLMVAIASSCSSNSTDSKETNKEAATSTANETTPAYPYTIKQPDNWGVGSTANTMTALTSIKKWEEGNMDESIKYFADTVRVQFDGLDKSVPRDTLKNMLAGLWNSYKTVNIKMEDWESVISKDKKQEWVTMWYTEHWETKNGVKDSAAIINDLQIVNGKIVRLDEYTRKLH